MIIVKFNNEGLIQQYIYDVKDAELDKNTILFDEDNYNKLIEWYKQEELQYLFNAEEFKIMGDVDLTLYLKKYEREFMPPFVTNKERIKQLEEENIKLKLEQQSQDSFIEVTMMATDEIYMMIEPLLDAVKQQSMSVLSDTLEKEVSKMVDFYAAMVVKGLKTIEEVPARYREQVREVLANLEK